MRCSRTRIEIAVLVHNAHTLLIKPFEETSSAEFEEVWRVACLGAFVAVGAVLPHMRTRHAGTIILSGATAARRGGANFAALHRPSSHCAASRSQCRASSGHTASMSHTS